VKRVRLLALGLAALAVTWVGPAASGPPLPVLFQSAPGRFEVAAVDVGGAQRVVAQATEAWQLLAGPLALPEAFPSPVFVRLIPSKEWTEPAPFRVFVEVGGVVSVRVRWAEATPEILVRRALVQGLLMRQAVARHGVSERLAAPLWLEQACVGWWRTRAEPALLDALKQSTAHRVPPALDQLLNWRRGEAEPVELSEGAVWLLAFLRSESGRPQEWSTFSQRLLGGEAPDAALAAAFPARFENTRERELWWQTGWHHLRRVRTLPGLEAAESRVDLADLGRFVVLRDGREVVMTLRDVLGQVGEPAVAEELTKRATAFNRVLPAVHPFYRNAALSFGELLAARDKSAKRHAALWAAFEADWRDAYELEKASAGALEAIELGRSLSSNPNLLLR
jgi:hypothetical protein